MTQLNNVTDLLKDMEIDDNIIKDVEDNISNHSISQNLIILRMKNPDMTKEKLSELSGLSLYAINKLETECNDNLNIGDIKKYIKCLGYSLSITFMHKVSPRTINNV